jgi:hypothetical protein
LFEANGVPTPRAPFGQLLGNDANGIGAVALRAAKHMRSEY